MPSLCHQQSRMLLLGVRRAILLSSGFVYHTDCPSGPIVIPKDKSSPLLAFTVLPTSVIVPFGVIRATLPNLVCVNHTIPSSAAAISAGPALGVSVSNCVTWLL